MPRDSVGHTIKVAIALCVVCSVLVSSAAVFLRPAQQRNKNLERQKNILLAAGLLESASASAKEIREAYQKVEPRLVDLETGEYVEPSELDLNDIEDFDQRGAANDPEMSTSIPSREDIAGIRRRENYSLVYLLKNGDGSLEQIILPVYGKGLWSTMYGFLSLDSDTVTVRGLTFYEHGETPGLGGEIENKAWQAQWEGKKAFGDEKNVQIEVVKGNVNPEDPNSNHQIDGLSGATITSRGVQSMMHFWLGEYGFGPFLENIREKGGQNG